MVEATLTLRTRYPLLPPGFVRWSEADRGPDPLARRWPIHRLTPTELATVAVSVDLSVEPTEDRDYTVAGWVATRLRAQEHNGSLFGRSSRDIAAELWSMFFAGPKPRYPHRGFDILALLDETGDSTGVAVWIDAAPTKEAPYHYRPMRFSQRLAELSAPSAKPAPRSTRTRCP